MLLVGSSVELTIASAERTCPIPSLNNPFETVTTHHSDVAALNNNDSVPRWAAVGKQLVAERVFRTAAMPRFVSQLSSVLKVVVPRGYRPDRSINLVPVKLVGLRKAYG